ncbi:Apolipoprotein N-acyltransferase [Microbacterium esteraromaticum]|uniref:Apolipoprotein N-acyltransferase n=1 Tax=Microbacterium esteraromaticum TaxID=57043 RepID=A0A1R4IR07_9MICO|nr:apolipoprotein N-acyltransferase [Microbacterium esteraromaticum]SJN22168.1 Apolipoprotein N-acyltransferase [Microbacterium esteraromaticum]
MKKTKNAPALPRPMMPLWVATWMAAAAGLSMYLAFPAFSAWPLAFVALALLLLALNGRRVGGAILVSAIYGVVFFFLLVSWTSRYLGPVPWAALATLEAALTAVALVPITLAYRWMPRVWPKSRLIALPLTVAALWTMQELFVGNWPYGGFPWARMGMTQSEGPFAAVASWVGVSGLSFLMVAVVALLIEVVRLRTWRRPAALIAPVAAVLVLLFTPLFPTADAGSMRIAAVQGNGTTGYFDKREEYGVITAQMAATEPLHGEDIDLIVWPEGGVDYDPFQDSSTARRLTRVVTSMDAPLLANTATERGDDIFNTSFLWTAEGTATQLHDKRHPVPFGEYVPDRAFFNLLAPDLVGLIQREYTPGSNPPIVHVGDVGVGLAICFDVIYDEVIREGVEAGAQVLVFQTNNADFRGTEENLQQLAFARMRAIETGRSVVNVSTVGTSQIIRPDGSTVSSLDADEAGALLDDVELRSGLTAGILLGPWVQLALLITGPMVLLVAGALNRRQR